MYPAHRPCTQRGPWLQGLCQNVLLFPSLVIVNSTTWSQCCDDDTMQNTKFQTPSLICPSISPCKVAPGRQPLWFPPPPLDSPRSGLCRNYTLPRKWRKPAEENTTRAHTTIIQHWHFTLPLHSRLRTHLSVIGRRSHYIRLPIRLQSNDHTPLYRLMTTSDDFIISLRLFLGVFTLTGFSSAFNSFH